MLHISSMWNWGAGSINPPAFIAHKLSDHLLETGFTEAAAILSRHLSRPRMVAYREDKLSQLV